MAADTATAGNVTQQPDPELLRKFEAERDAARADKVRGQQMQREAEEEISRAKEDQRQSHEQAVKELCAIGALPSSECP